VIVSIKAYDRITGVKLEIHDDESYQLCVTKKGTLYVCSLTEKDEDGFNKELDVRFVIEAT